MGIFEGSLPPRPASLPHKLSIPLAPRLRGRTGPLARACAILFCTCGLEEAGVSGETAPCLWFFSKELLGTGLGSSSPTQGGEDGIPTPSSAVPGMLLVTKPGCAHFRIWEEDLKQ